MLFWRQKIHNIIETGVPDHTDIKPRKSENFSDKPQRVESENEISQMVLCSFPGCAFFAEKVGESQQRDHLRLNHSNSEWTETSFITINSAMSEAMDLLQGMKEEKSAVLT